MSVFTHVTCQIQVAYKMEASVFINIFEKKIVELIFKDLKIFCKKYIFLQNEISPTYSVKGNWKQPYNIYANLTICVQLGREDSNNEGDFISCSTQWAWALVWNWNGGSCWPPSQKGGYLFVLSGSLVFLGNRIFVKHALSMKVNHFILCSTQCSSVLVLDKKRKKKKNGRKETVLTLALWYSRDNPASLSWKIEIHCHQIQQQGLQLL